MAIQFWYHSFASTSFKLLRAKIREIVRRKSQFYVGFLFRSCASAQIRWSLDQFLSEHFTDTSSFVLFHTDESSWSHSVGVQRYCFIKAEDWRSAEYQWSSHTQIHHANVLYSLSSKYLDWFFKAFFRTLFLIRKVLLCRLLVHVLGLVRVINPSV